MAIIYSYPKQTTPNDSDSLVITDSSQSAPNKNRTKSLTVGDLGDYIISSNSGITGLGTLNKVARFTAPTVIGDSSITDDGTSVVISTELTCNDGLNTDGDVVIGVTSDSDEFTVNNSTEFTNTVKFEKQILDGTSGAGTAGQVLSSTGTGVAWISDGGGTVTGTGTPSTLTMWNTAGTGIQDSIVKEVAGTAYATTKNLVIDGGIYQSNTGKSVIIGELALQNGTSGTDGENVALGYEALKANTTGTNNVAIGSETLKTVTIGKNNIAIGKKALELSTSDNNIALGFNALNVANVQENNVVIGSTNLQNTVSTAITNNVVVGKGAGNSNTLSGPMNQNIIIGPQAFQTSTASTVNDCIFVGQNAGKSLKGVGDNDIGIGKSAFLGTNSGFTSGGNNIAIGEGAQGTNTTTTSNSICIGKGEARTDAICISTFKSGLANTASGTHSAIIGGYDNTVANDVGFIGGGHSNTITSVAKGGAILGGYNNNVTSTGNAGIALGSDLEVTGTNQVVVGRFNSSNTNSRFMVGVGTNAGDRKNGFEVMQGAATRGQLRLAQYPSNFTTTSGVPDIDLLVIQANGLVYKTPAETFQNGSKYQPNSTLTCSAGGQTNEGPNIARFTKISWTGADGSHGISLPSPGGGPPTVANRIVEYLTDGTFSAARSVDFTVSGAGLINGVTSKTITGKYQSIKFWSDGTEWYILNQQT